MWTRSGYQSATDQSIASQRENSTQYICCAGVSVVPVFLLGEGDADWSMATVVVEGLARWQLSWASAALVEAALRRPIC
jgi:hypothetical protein